MKEVWDEGRKCGMKKEVWDEGRKKRQRKEGEDICRTHTKIKPTRKTTTQNNVSTSLKSPWYHIGVNKHSLGKLPEQFCTLTGLLVESQSDLGWRLPSTWLRQLTLLTCIPSRQFNEHYSLT